MLKNALMNEKPLMQERENILFFYPNILAEFSNALCLQTERFEKKFEEQFLAQRNSIENDEVGNQYTAFNLFPFSFCPPQLLSASIFCSKK